jgi:hypothetical protein
MSAIQQRVSHRRLFLRPGVTTEIAAPSMVETVNARLADLLGQCPVVAQGAGDAEQPPGHHASFRLQWA